MSAASQDDGPVRAILADDHTMVREALARILEDSGRIQVLGQAGDGSAALAAALATEADVLVLDYNMPGTPALDIITELGRQRPALRVLVLTVYENIHYAIKVLECGAFGYVLKAAAARELVQAIESVHRGEVYVSPRVSQRVLQHLRMPKGERVGLAALSQREFEMLRILASGMSLKECATHLNIGISTASTYRSRLMEKLHLRTTAEIIRFALDNDIVR